MRKPKVAAKRARLSKFNAATAGVMLVPRDTAEAVKKLATDDLTTPSVGVAMEALNCFAIFDGVPKVSPSTSNKSAPAINGERCRTHP